MSNNSHLFFVDKQPGDFIKINRVESPRDVYTAIILEIYDKYTEVIAYDRHTMFRIKVVYDDNNNIYTLINPRLISKDVLQAMYKYVINGEDIYKMNILSWINYYSTIHHKTVLADTTDYDN